ncbi:hypothetical protein [Nocardia panacis]|uniref:hypothetical protein n=1 Tax=Nocardia panacis TaxID=2340916 RepID=UPI0011C3E4D2|nr:hypothetical protein [Nocardia panacis]
MVSVEAQTSTDLEPSRLPGGFFHPGNYWNVVDATGVTRVHPDTDPTYRCTKADWPVDLTPGSRYQFHLTFDSPTPTGFLTFVPTTGQPGWEYPF